MAVTRDYEKEDPVSSVLYNLTLAIYCLWELAEICMYIITLIVNAHVLLCYHIYE